MVSQEQLMVQQHQKQHYIITNLVPQNIQHQAMASRLETTAPSTLTTEAHRPYLRTYPKFIKLFHARHGFNKVKI